nr:hypothetical protein [Deltaproteobacteria bacterium]
MGRYFAQVTVTLAAALAFGGCPVTETQVIAPIPPMATGKVRVRVFTEPAPVRQVTSVGALTFVATDNELSRWDDLGVATSELGVPAGAHVVAMVAEPARNQLWILSELGLGHYDIATDNYSELVPPPTALGVDYALMAKEGATLAPAGDGGVWLGTTRGLFYASAQGGWTATPIN